MIVSENALAQLLGLSHGAFFIATLLSEQADVAFL